MILMQKSILNDLKSEFLNIDLSDLYMEIQNQIDDSEYSIIKYTLQ